MIVEERKATSPVIKDRRRGNVEDRFTDRIVKFFRLAALVLAAGVGFFTLGMAAAVTLSNGWKDMMVAFETPAKPVALRGLGL